MKIVNTLIEDFGNFELDFDLISLQSINDQEIRLPYRGDLPDQMRLASSAYIYFNIQVMQPVKMILVALLPNGKQIRRPLDATNQEIINLMNRFFARPDRTGLSPYWTGIWQANYITWSQAVRSPERLLPFLNGIPAHYKDILIKCLSANK